MMRLPFFQCLLPVPTRNSVLIDFLDFSVSGQEALAASKRYLSLDKQSPVPRSIESPEQGNIVAIPHVGGLHNEYRRAA